ncbi:FG-GAP-like repeat-containing protein [Streptomyces phaeofaciens]|uniref:FG-GAP-like repeat-containing protein n=1 Tax=Streptomyces phaeofaciens TaxID=68254 RepID=UPI0036CC11E5
MGRSALPSRRRATATALIAVSLALAGATLPAAPAVAAPVLPPWTGPVSLSMTKSKVRDLVVTADGSAVVIWTETVSGTLHAARQAANSDTWSTPVKLGGTTFEARLAARPDGSVVALWTDSGTGTGWRTLSAVLAAGQTAWSQPTVLDSAGVSSSVVPDIAVGPGGVVAAVWGRSANSRSEVFASLLYPEGTWSEPEQVSNAATHAGTAYYGNVAAPQIAFDGQGGLVVSYWMSVGEIYRVMTSSRPAETFAWRTPEMITASYQTPTLGSAPDGSLHLVYKDLSGSFQVLRRADAASAWSGPRTAASAVGTVAEMPRPLVGPDGDVTLVWFDRATGADDVRTTTFDGATGEWAESRTLSAGTAATSDAEIAPDGSVHVLWPESDAQGGSLFEATLVDGEWTAARRVGGGTGASGEIAAGSAGGATAVWGAVSNYSSYSVVTASRTRWPALAVTNASVPVTAPLKGTTSSSTAWKPTWTTNSPVSSWTLTLTDTAGKAVRTLTGTTAAGSTAVAPVWNGRTSTGAIAVNGRLTWTLKAVQWGSGSASTLATGTVTVTGGSPAFRDFGGHDVTPDGLGDLLQLDTSGRIQWDLGDGTGQLETGASATGWSTSIKAVPFGDLNGERCNDVLVRVGDALRAYRPACGTAPKPTTTYKTISSTGWKQYDVLTHPGDVTKDGRPDLIARNASTGAVYLYKGTSTAGLSARVKLYDNWKTYKKVVGAGDLNGDGIGDLLAQDTADNLYRYYGKGDGTFSSRAKIATNWGASYNVVVGVGDLNRDGKADLVARDTAGNLYRQAGTGKGTFGSRVKIGGGFNRYKGLF